MFSFSNRRKGNILIDWGDNLGLTFFVTAAKMRDIKECLVGILETILCNYV